MGIRALPIKGTSSYAIQCAVFGMTEQLPDAKAKNFSPTILRQAMLDTLAALNELADSAGISEVYLPCTILSLERLIIRPHSPV